MNIVVQTSSFSSTAGLLLVAGRSFPCLLGRGGITIDKTEGDGKTPVGTYALRRLFYRSDRVAKPATQLLLQEIKQMDGWCDDPAHPLYNQLVQKPFAASHEDMFRDDHVYDVVVELGYNDQPIQPGRGSAIFMHVMRPEKTPTAGCIALTLEDLLSVVAVCDRESFITILPPADS